MAVKNSKPRKVRARLTFVWVDGARPPVYKTTIVRNRHSGRLVEVALAPSEHPPLDEGDDGTTYVVTKGEEFFSDDIVVRAKPMYFVDAE